MSADLPKFTAFNCAAIGVAGTTNAFVQKVGDQYVARVGIAIFGQTNMKDSELANNANPFDESFRDNYAEGTGKTLQEAIDNLKKDVKAISESLWL